VSSATTTIYGRGELCLEGEIIVFNPLLK